MQKRDLWPKERATGRGMERPVQRKLYLLFFISPTLTYFPPFQNPGNPWGKQGRMLDACGTTAFWIPQHRDDAALGNPMGKERH